MGKYSHVMVLGVSMGKCSHVVVLGVSMDMTGTRSIHG